MTRRAPFLTGLFMICMATLMIQIIETRILSVVSMYYLAFLSISMAMLGMTAGALFVHFRLVEVTPENVASVLSRVSTAFALVLFSCFLLQLASPIPMVMIGTQVIVWLKLLVLLAVPFTVAGVAVSLALTRSPFPIGITYGVDLGGAALGCLIAPFLMNRIDPASVMFCVAAIAALAGVFFRAAGGEPVPAIPLFGWKLLRRPGIVTVVLLVVAAANATTRFGLQPISAKFNEIRAGKDFEFEKWNSFSRIIVERSEERPPVLWGASPRLPLKDAEQRGLNIDGLAGTTMPRFTGNTGDVSFLRFDLTNLAYAARPNGKTAVIGVGSGRDLLSAYVFGSRDITGIEVNPIFVDLLTDPDKLRGYAGIADLPGVTLIVDEGRSWFARTQQRFDLIEMSMIDTFASTGMGAFSLSENGLYTVEGWRIFLSALRPDGLFSVSRWHAETAPIEMGRTTSLAMAALFSLGVERPRDHIFLASVRSLATLVVSRSPFTADDLRKLEQTAVGLQFRVLATPGQIPGDPVFADLLSATSTEDLNQRARKYWLDVSAPTDARPFFFNQLRLFNLTNLKLFAQEYRRTNSTTMRDSLVIVGNVVAVSTPFLLILLSLGAVIVTILLPIRSSIQQVEPRLAVLGSAYFLLIGLGFMFIEISLIQRISIFMGHPTYALSIVLFSIILSAGIGSLLSEKLMPNGRNAILVWLGLLVIYLVALPHWLPAMARSLESAALLSRALTAVAVILPAGIQMGFAFPFGMELVIGRDQRSAPWFWGINGAASVLAAGVAVASSIAFSIDTTIRIGALCYLILAPTALLLRSTCRDASPRQL